MDVLSKVSRSTDYGDAAAFIFFAAGSFASAAASSSAPASLWRLCPCAVPHTRLAEVAGDARMLEQGILYELVHSYKRRLVRGFVCWCLSNLVDRRGAIVNGNLELVLHSLKIEQIVLWRAAL